MDVDERQARGVTFERLTVTGLTWKMERGESFSFQVSEE
jgi:hypothetical protein